MTQIRLGTPGDAARERELWQLAFGDDGAYVDNFYQTYYKPERMLLLEEDGVVQSMTAWFDTQLVLPGEDQLSIEPGGHGLDHAVLLQQEHPLRLVIGLVKVVHIGPVIPEGQLPELTLPGGIAWGPKTYLRHAVSSSFSDRHTACPLSVRGRRPCAPQYPGYTSLLRGMMTAQAR